MLIRLLVATLIGLVGAGIAIAVGPWSPARALSASIGGAWAGSSAGATFGGLLDRVFRTDVFRPIFGNAAAAGGSVLALMRTKPPAETLDEG